MFKVADNRVGKSELVQLDVACQPIKGYATSISSSRRQQGKSHCILAMVSPTAQLFIHSHLLQSAARSCLAIFEVAIIWDSHCYQLLLYNFGILSNISDTSINFLLQATTSNLMTFFLCCSRLMKTSESTYCS